MSSPRSTTAHTLTPLQATYPCTFEGCGRTFNRADWEEHEKSTHLALELWKCVVWGCKKVTYRPETHAEHLRNIHLITDPAEITAMSEEGHIGPGSFWCGFCKAVVRPQCLKWAHLTGHVLSGEKIKDYEYP